MHIIQTIEDAVVSVLAPLAGQGVGTIEAYAGELEIAIMVDLADLPRRMPALLVSVGNLALEVRNRVDIGRVDLDVALCTRHLRGTGRASRNPAPGVPGLFQLMEQVENILNGRKIMPGWSAFRWMGVQKWNKNPNQSLCVYLEKFQTSAPLNR